MKIEAHYTFTTRDAEGRVIKHIRRVSRSYVIAFVDILWQRLNAVANGFTTLTTGGLAKTLGTTGTGPSLAAANNDDLLGLVVGKNSQAVVITDNKLIEQIPHGVIPNTLDYEAQTAVDITTVGSTRAMRQRRIFINSSGGAITINECGAYVKAQDTAPSEKVFCIIRDVVAGGLSVPNGGSATLTYTIGVTA